MGDDYNRRRSTQWRELAMLFLRAETGIPVTKQPTGRTLAELFASEPSKQGDLLGIKNWTLNSSAADRLDVSGPLDELERERLANGDQYGAVIKFRRTRPTAEAFAILSFETLARLIKATS